MEYRRDDVEVLAFVERFSSLLIESGWPRMPARVFVALLTTDSGRMTAAELAEVLQVSPAAISGAVRYLTRFHLASREREPGSRRDVYHVRNDIWQEAITGRDQILTHWENGLREGVKVLGPDTPAGARLTESVEFFEFMQAELTGMLARWREHRDRMRDEMRDA